MAASVDEACLVARRVVGELFGDGTEPRLDDEGQRWALVAGLVLGGEIEEMDGDE